MSRFRWLAALALLVAGAALVSNLVTIEPLVERANAWTAEQGLLGMVLFALASGLAVVFLFPGSVLMATAGAAFGLARGFVIAQAAASLGAGLAFFVSRYLARGRVERWVSTRPAFAAVDQAIGSEGWKIVLLTRCCPLFPYIFQNYAYGITRVSFGHYALGSFLGLVPATLVFAYVGSLGRSGVEVAAAGGGAAELALKSLGLVATLVAAAYVTRLSRRALEKEGL